MESWTALHVQWKRHLALDPTLILSALKLSRSGSEAWVVTALTVSLRTMLARVSGVTSWPPSISAKAFTHAYAMRSTSGRGLPAASMISGMGLKYC